MADRVRGYITTYSLPRPSFIVEFVTLTSHKISSTVCYHTPPLFLYLFSTTSRGLNHDYPRTMVGVWTLLVLSLFNDLQLPVRWTVPGREIISTNWLDATAPSLSVSLVRNEDKRKMRYQKTTSEDNQFGLTFDFPFHRRNYSRQFENSKFRPIDSYLF